MWLHGLWNILYNIHIYELKKFEEYILKLDLVKLYNILNGFVEWGYRVVGL